MSEIACPRCGEAASGNFCASCGAALAPRHCTECGAKADPGARFCTTCGTPVAGAGALAAAEPSPPPSAAPSSSARAAGSGGGVKEPRRGAQAAASTGGGDSKAPWLIAGGMFIALMGVLVWPILQPDEVAPVPLPVGGAPGAGGIGDASSVDLSSMTPREQADRLFTRVMTAAEAQDSVQVAFFVPMAIQAYENVQPLDADGLFHLSMLQQTANDLEVAIATAEQGLADQPNHLLLLYAKAEALVEAGDTATAEATFEQLLDVWDAERATDNIDYVAHDNMFGSIEARAREITGR